MGAFLIALLTSVAQTAGPSPAIVQRALDLEVRLDYDAGTVTGTARITVENVGPTPLDAEMARLAQRLLQRLTTEQRTVPMIEYGSAGLTDLSYSVGALMFYLRHETLGAEGFDAALGSYYRAHSRIGTSTREFADWLTEIAPALRETILEDWLFSTRGIERLTSGESLASMRDQYRRPLP
jgi:hypothetical protein